MPIYEIYFNDKHFTNLLAGNKSEKDIPIILGFPNLIFIKKEKIDENIKIFYQLNELMNIKIYLNKNFIFERLFPPQIHLNRLRDLLSQKINKNFTFSYNHKIIQIQEESPFCLKNIILDDAIYLYDYEFIFIREIETKENKSDFVGLDKNKINIKNLKEKNCSIQNNTEESKKFDKEEPKDSLKEKETEEIKNQSQPISEIVNEKEYELVNKKDCIYKIKIYPEMNLSDLREKIINIIPKRTLFLMKDKNIDPSKEKDIKVKDIAIQNIINLEVPLENMNETMEIEIFLNRKFYIKKDFYLFIKLKKMKINLKLDKNYKFIYKGEIVPIEEEDNMTLNDLCYKELKVFLIKVKEENNDEMPKNSNSIKSFSQDKKLDKKILSNNFKENSIFDIWIIMGKEKSGKTHFINCLVNYLLGVKFEDNYRYKIEGKKEIGYEIYDIEGNGISRNIRIIEFPGYSGESKTDKIINENIKKVIKLLNEIKLICFVISGNETRLTDELKNIFSNALNIFAFNLRNNFIFVITNCDAKKPPVIDCIKDSNFAKVFHKQLDNIIFKFSNSYLFDVQQKDLWDIGVYHYNIFLKDVGKITNASLNQTKNLVDFDFAKKSKNYLDSLLKIINYNNYYNILKNIDAYNNKKYNIDIPFDHLKIEKFCAKCKKKIVNTPCSSCGNSSYYEQKQSNKKIALQQLKSNRALYSECLKSYKNNVKEKKYNSAILYKNLMDFYNIKLLNENSLEKDLEGMIDNKNKDKNAILEEINYQKKLYNSFLNSKKKLNIKIIC